MSSRNIIQVHEPTIATRVQSIWGCIVTFFSFQRLITLSVFCEVYRVQIEVLYLWRYDTGSLSTKGIYAQT